jgi:hypothetical protein
MGAANNGFAGFLNGESQVWLFQGFLIFIFSVPPGKYALFYQANYKNECLSQSGNCTANCGMWSPTDPEQR